MSTTSTLADAERSAPIEGDVPESVVAPLGAPALSGANPPSVAGSRRGGSPLRASSRRGEHSPSSKSRRAREKEELKAVLKAAVKASRKAEKKAVLLAEKKAKRKADYVAKKRPHKDKAYEKAVAKLKGLSRAVLAPGLVLPRPPSCPQAADHAAQPGLSDGLDDPSLRGAGVIPTPDLASMFSRECMLDRVSGLLSSLRGEDVEAGRGRHPPVEAPHRNIASTIVKDVVPLNATDAPCTSYLGAVIAKPSVATPAFTIPRCTNVAPEGSRTEVLSPRPGYFGPNPGSDWSFQPINNAAPARAPPAARASTPSMPSPSMPSPSMPSPSMYSAEVTARSLLHPLPDAFTPPEMPEFGFTRPAAVPFPSPFSRPPAGFALDAGSSVSSSSAMPSVEPSDSISNVGSSVSDAPTQENVFQAYVGLETSQLPGLQRALPKFPRLTATAAATEAIWFHMRGYGGSSKEWPKADQVEKQFSSESSPAFNPPALPAQLPVDPGLTKSDAKLVKRQRSYAAPAHIVASLMDQLGSSVLLPLARAASTVTDPDVMTDLAHIHEFITGQAAYQMGLAVRSLGASYNALASERRESLLRTQTPEIKRALTDNKPGFRAFFHEDITPALQVATQASQMKLTQATLASLARLTSSNKSAPRKPYHGGGGGGGRNFSGNRYQNQNQNNNSRYQNQNQNQNRQQNDKSDNKWKGNDKSGASNNRKPNFKPGKPGAKKPYNRR
jgi:hypothetical protein